MTHLIRFISLTLCLTFFVSAEELPVSPDAEIVKIADGFGFTEGPTADSKGNVYFVDDPNSKIHCWNVQEEKVSVFVEKSAHANGMYFDTKDQLIVCEGGTGSVVSYDQNAKRTVIASTYQGKQFNKPNDLWIDPKGGIYFTDPVYGKEFSVVQDGEHVYYILPDRSKTIRVVQDMVKPNGLIGTPDGKTLYITDNGTQKVWKYAVQPDGTLAEKTLFADQGVDGMSIDHKGNVYITTNQIVILTPEGKVLQEIKLPEVPANLCFGGKKFDTLYVTARKGLYRIKTNVHGVK